MRSFTISCTVIILLSIFAGNIPNSHEIQLETRDSEGKLVSVIGSPITSNPFEIGTWGAAILISNTIVFVGLVISYHKSQVRIKRSINFITNLEVPPKLAYVIVITILSIYIMLNASALGKEENFGDYSEVKKYAGEWDISKVKIGIGAELRYFFLHLSLNIFHNIRVIPFIGSIFLIVLTYLLTAELSGNRLGGIIAMIVLLQSNLFLTYVAASTQDNFWILFYIIALYLLTKRPYLSPLPYIASLFLKALTVAFLPTIFLFIYRLNIPSRKKIHVTISYGIITTLLIIAFIAGFTQIEKTYFNFGNFWAGFTVGSLQLRFDALVPLFIIPLIVGLFLVSRKGMLYADNAMILIAGTILTYPLLELFTDITNQPYRLIPLVVFFAVGVGMLFTKNNKNPVPAQKTRLVSNAIFFVTFTVGLIFSLPFIFPALIQSIVYG